nr:C5 protein [Malvastrum yellow mosaic virus]
MEQNRTNNVCRHEFGNKIRSLLILNRIIEIDPDFQRSIQWITRMSTCHIQQQSILSVVIILSSFLMIISNMVINLHKLPN